MQRLARRSLPLVALPLFILNSCKTRHFSDRPADSRAMMVLTSTPKCDAALKDLSSLAELSATQSEDLAVAKELCSDVSPGSGLQHIPNRTGKALCEAAAKHVPFGTMDAFVKWSAASSITHTMSCSSYGKGGAIRYGKKAYKQVLRVFLLALIPDPVPNQTSFGKCTFKGDTPDLNFLIKTNSLLPLTIRENLEHLNAQERTEYHDKIFTIRSASIKTGIRTDEVFQGIPMTPEEVTFLEKEWSDGTMWVNEREPFMSFDMTPPARVSGKFAYHTRSTELCAKLENFQSDALKFRKMNEGGTKSKTETIAAVAELTRRCVAIHPFGDGNGRACGMWATHLLAQAKVLPSVRWPHPDYSITLKDYTERFSAGVDNAELLKASAEKAAPEKAEAEK